MTISKRKHKCSLPIFLFVFRLSNLNRGSVRLRKSVLMHGQGSNNSLSFNNPKWLFWNIRTALPVMNLVALAHSTVYLNKLVSGKLGFLEHAEKKKSRKSMLQSLVFYFSCFRIHLKLIKISLCFVIWMKHGKR